MVAFLLDVLGFKKLAPSMQTGWLCHSNCQTTIDSSILSKDGSRRHRDDSRWFPE